MGLLEHLSSVYLAAGKLVEAHCDLLYPCDLDCEHCYLDDKARPQRTTAFWKDVFDQLADMQVVMIHLSGGEIFLRKDLFELIEHARSRGLMVCLKTHGGHVTEAHAQRLAELGVSLVYVSYYSHRPEVHDAITREPGSQARTLAGLEHLASAGLRVKVNLVVMERNVADVSCVLRQCAELGIAVGITTEIHSAISGDETPLDVALSPEERATFHELIDTRTSSCAVDSASNGWGERRICGAANTIIYIDPQGQVMPCIFWPQPLGTLGPDQALAPLLDASPLLDRMRAYRNRDRHTCGSCAGKESCRFCPGQSWHETGDLMAPAAAICADTYSKLVGQARAAGEPEPPMPPGLTMAPREGADSDMASGIRRSPFRVLTGDQAACRG